MPSELKSKSFYLLACGLVLSSCSHIAPTQPLKIYLGEQLEDTINKVSRTHKVTSVDSWVYVSDWEFDGYPREPGGFELQFDDRRCLRGATSLPNDIVFIAAKEEGGNAK